MVCKKLQPFQSSFIFSTLIFNNTLNRILYLINQNYKRINWFYAKHFLFYKNIRNNFYL